MIDDNKIDEFLMHWRFINRHLREGKLSHGDKKITRLQWTLLRHVSRTDQCTMGSLAEHFNVSMSTVSQMIDRLENWGYVQRGSSARDARVKIVSLTEKGEAIIEDVTAAYLKLLNNGLSSFSSNEQDQFIGFLKRLAEEIKRGQSPLDSDTPSNP